MKKHRANLMPGISFDALAQHAERAAGLQGLLQLLEELGLGGGRVLGLQLLPFAGLSLLHESKNQFPVDGERPVIIGRLPRDIALRGDQSINKVLFERDLMVGVLHDIGGHASPSDIGAHICLRGSLARVPSESSP